MGQCPYKNGDVISLEEQYVVINPIDETSEYWLIESIQVATKKKVIVKVFISESFSNVEALEQTWREEVKKFESADESIPKNYQYIESGYVMVSGKRQFIIVFDDDELIQEPDFEKQLVDDVKELPAAPGAPSTSSDILPEDISEALDKVIEAYPEEKEKVAIDDVAKDTDEIERIEAGSSKEEREPRYCPFCKSEYEETKFCMNCGKSSEEISLPESAPPPTTGAPVDTKPRRREKKDARKRKMEAMPTPVLEDERAVLATPIEEKDYLKHISMEYFDRMNPQNYYPLKIKLSDLMGETIIPTVNPLTGERKVQKKDEMDVTIKDPIVTIRPTIPGCSVVPNQIDTDFTLSEDEVTFFITPGVKGEIIGHIEFINEDITIYKTDFEAKVVDPRVARLVTVYGIITSFIPKIFAIIGIDFGLEDLLNTGTLLDNIGIPGLIALGGIIPAILVGIIVRQKLKPRSCKTHYKIRDFRLKSLKRS